MPFATNKYIYDEGPPDAKIMFVGEAPGSDEYLEGHPFIGPSGQILTTCLNRNGVSRSEVRLANLFHYKIEKNDFKSILGTQEFREQLKELYDYIKLHRPVVLVPLGSWPLKFLTGREKITKWRGSIISYIGDESIKVIPTVHPAAVLRDGTYYPTFDRDIKRIIGDSEFREKRLPERRFIINPTGLEAEEWTERIIEQAKFVGTDIETVKGSTRILCCGFAPSPEVGVCFVPDHPDGKKAISRILESDVDKIFQFGTFDTLQLGKENGYRINPGRIARQLDRPYFWDTLIAQHILTPELPRSLEYLTSIHTREPYYKTVGRATIPDDTKGWSEKVEKQSLYEYNCRDCCVTIESAIVQMQELEEESENMRRMFDFEMSMLDVTYHISAAGFQVDHERRQLLMDVELDKWRRKQYALDRIVGISCNVRSPKLKEILYGQLGLPVRKNREGGITTDEDATVASITYCKDHIAKLKTENAKFEWEKKLAVCKLVLEIRGIRQVLANYLLPKIGKSGKDRFSSDGRVRSTFRMGPETGRWSATKYIDGSGFNGQTLPRDPIEVPDDFRITPEAATLTTTLGDADEDKDDEIEESEE